MFIVSIHAPVWGATYVSLICSFVTMFQSTPPYGGRRLIMGSVLMGIVVSIHAPVWGATYKSCVMVGYIHGFNPRPRMGGDSPGILRTVTGRVSIHAPVWGATYGHFICHIFYMFQSTPPYGGRPGQRTNLYSDSCFNPRPRMGGDARLGIPTASNFGFQSTPPYGGRLLLCKP